MSELRQQGFDEVRVTRERVVELAALAGAPEARQIRRQPARARQQLDPVVGARGDPVEVERRRASAPGALR